MNHYPRHIGDYLKDTAHLTLLEHGVYTRLLDVYYTREGAIPEDQAARLVGARSKDERDALQAVLSEFFALEDGQWRQKRADAEIARYLEKAERNREVGKKGGRPRTQQEPTNNPDGFQNETQGEPTDNPSHKPVASSQNQNQEKQGGADPVGRGGAISSATPPTPRRAVPAGTRLAPDFVLPQQWGEWALQERPGWTPDKVRSVAEQFRDHWHAKAGRDALKADWLAAWRNWVRKEAVINGAYRKPEEKPLSQLLAERDAAEAAEAAALAAGGTHASH